MTKAFNWSSTTTEVLEGVDLRGQTVLVTGASAGLGAETARVLVAHGAHVIGTARDAEKMRRAAAGFTGSGSFESVAVDLASLASIRACTDILLQRKVALNVIIANAGIMACPFGHTADGFELQFGTNHLGHFLLVNRLAPLLTNPGRLVVLSSRGHHISDVDLDDPNFEHTPYDELVAYGRAKTANILFAAEFDRRHRGRGVRATALHPGGIRTELMRHLTPAVYQRMIDRNTEANKGATTPSQGLKTVEQGAATSVWAGFVAPAEAIGGHYCEDCNVAGPADEERSGVKSYALDPSRAKALWAKSETMVAEHF